MRALLSRLLCLLLWHAWEPLAERRAPRCRRCGYYLRPDDFGALWLLSLFLAIFLPLAIALALALASCAGELIPGPRGGRDAGSADVNTNRGDAPQGQ